MSLDRFGAIVWMADHSRAIVDAVWARSLAESVGVPFHRLLDLDPQLVRVARGEFSRDDQRRQGWLIHDRSKLSKDLVQISDLAAAMARYMGLYANIDHARQSPHGTRGKQAQYIAQRACLRMARHFWPDSGERDLLQEVPSIAAAGVGAIVKDERTGAKILARDGTPLVVGRDALLRERIYRP